MTKNERQKLLALLESALTVNQLTTYSYTHPTGAFNRGYEWGLQVAMEAVGFTKDELWELWSAVIDDCHRRKAERNRA